MRLTSSKRTDQCGMIVIMEVLRRYARNQVLLFEIQALYASLRI